MARKGKRNTRKDGRRVARAALAVDENARADVRVVREAGGRRRVWMRVLTVLGWLVSALAVALCAAVWWVCARLELLFTAAGVRELANLGADGARERLASVQLEALTPFVALYGWRYVAVAVILSAGFGVGFTLLWLGRAR
jgi:hypothetical protein